MTDYIQQLKDEAKATYLSRLHSIELNTKVYLKADVLRMKLRTHFPDCDIMVHSGAYKPIVQIYLTGNMNIAKDINGFLDEESDFIDFLLDGEELKAEDYEGRSYDMNLGCLNFEVYYLGGNCTRVKVREELIMKPVYQVVCN